MSAIIHVELAWLASTIAAVTVTPLCILYISRD